MIKRALGTELNADIDLDFASGGLVCTVTAPLPSKDAAP
jgi:hypothetical protein